MRVGGGFDPTWSGRKGLRRQRNHRQTDDGDKC
jgi:hypothetical protein